MAKTKIDLATQTSGHLPITELPQASADSVLVGSGAAGSGAAYTEIALGTNLSMSGTTLNASGGGGGGTVTTVSVATANGFQGTVATPTTTPAISVDVDSSHYLPTTTDEANWNAKAPLASPNFTGIPAAPTASPGTNTTQLATTAFVEAAIPTSLPPSGTAGGDLNGTYPNPGVAQINGASVPVSEAYVGTNGSGQIIAAAAPPGGTVTTTSSPSSGNLTKFSGSTSITNGDLTGDVTTSGTLAATLGSNFKLSTVGITIDGAGTTPATGTKGYIQVPYSGTIIGWSLVADQSGSASIAIWKEASSAPPATPAIPTIGNIISASAPCALSSAQSSSGGASAISTWTVSVAAWDVFAFSLNAATTVTRLTLTLYITRS